MELNFTETQGSSSFFFKSDGESFVIPGLEINQTTGMLKSVGLSQLGQEMKLDSSPFASLTRDGTTKSGLLSVPGLNLQLKLTYVDEMLTANPQAASGSTSTDSHGSSTDSHGSSSASKKAKFNYD